MMKELAGCRREIDAIDEELQKLLMKRLTIASEIAAWKKAHASAVLDAAREQEILNRAQARGGEKFGAESVAFFRALMAISRDFQQKLLTSLADAGK